MILMENESITQRRAVALTIAGSDSSCGAGIQADLKTFAAHKIYGVCAITALTAQNTLGVQGIFAPPASFLSAQMDSVCSDIQIDSVKIGMVFNDEIIAVICEKLVTYRLKNIVLDPVMIATSGDQLLNQNAIKLLKEKLIPLCMVLTPNLPEAAALLQTKVAQTQEEIIAQGKQILALGCPFVLIKGGHFVSQDCPDILVSHDHVLVFSQKRINTQNTHGTGCSLSSAIAANLAKGFTIVDAIEAAKTYVFQAIHAATYDSLGKGHGPIHHFYAHG